MLAKFVHSKDIDRAEDTGRAEDEEAEDDEDAEDEEATKKAEGVRGAWSGKWAEGKEEATGTPGSIIGSRRCMYILILATHLCIVVSWYVQERVWALSTLC